MQSNVSVKHPMKALPVTVNRVSRVGRVRRLVLVLLGVTIVLLAIRLVAVEYLEGRRYVSGGLSAPPRPPRPYNKYINEAGQWLPYGHLRIVQHVVSPLDRVFADFHSFLDQNDEWKLYFQYVPTDSFHVVLAEFRVASKLNNEDLERLREEQQHLDERRVDMDAKSRKIVFVDREEIRVEVEYSDGELNELIRPLQSRWRERYPSLLVEVTEKFFITVAVQYKDLPNDEMKEKLRQTFTQWDEAQMEIPLDPLEICNVSTLVSYETVFP